MKICQREGCLNKVQARGFCKAHYQKALKAGEIQRLGPKRKSVPHKPRRLPKILTPKLPLALPKIREILGRDLVELYLRREEVVPFVYQQVRHFLNTADACILVLPDNDLIPHAVGTQNADLYIAINQCIGWLDKNCTPEDVSAMIYGG
jgi:hypothetical protein